MGCLNDRSFLRIAKYAAEDILADGIAKKKDVTSEDVDKHELDMGLEVEKEHTSYPEVAEEITLDHLAEIDNYYTLLKNMEDKAKKKIKAFLHFVSVKERK